MKLFLAGLLAVVSLQAAAEVSSDLKLRLSRDLNYIAGVYDTQYAPKDWKERHLNWDLQKELAKSQSMIQNAQTVHDYREALASFIRSTADYHVSFGFTSTEAATLPLVVRTYEGKSLIVAIDRSKLSLTTFPFDEGDELLSMNGTTISDLKKVFIQNMGNNVASTDEAIADLTITRRRASKNLVVPKGPVLLEIKKANGQVVNHQLVWEYTPESIKARVKTPVSEIEAPTKFVFKSPNMVNPMAKDFARVGSGHGLGERKSFLPNFGARIWESATDSEFDAYIFKNAESKLIGVVRVPSYTPTDAVKAVKDFAVVIRKMETLTDGLIIDQVNNPGGSVFYLYALASMLTKDSLATPKHRINLAPSDVAEALSLQKALENIKTDEEAIKALGPTLGGYPSSYQIVVNLREFARFTIEQWDAGKKITEPYFLWGVDRINPHPEVNYTKPIVLLVNELDFSGGDFFPAILQDNRRVTVVGTRTSGAGGYVLQSSFANSFGLEYISYTGSIAERVDLNPIENLGVRPDVVVPFTVEDIRNNYRVYTKEVQAILKKAMN